MMNKKDIEKIIDEKVQVDILDNHLAALWDNVYRIMERLEILQEIKLPDHILEKFEPFKELFEWKEGDDENDRDKSNED